MSLINTLSPINNHEQLKEDEMGRTGFDLAQDREHGD
jgi:hypothetical protein